MHIYRRVEDDMRPLVKSAMQTSLAVARSVRKTELEGKKNKNKTENAKSAVRDVVRSPSPVPLQKHAGRPKEFETTSSSAPRRLNDIAQAPPEFKKLPHGAVKRAVRGGGGGDGGGGKREGVLSMAQRVMMEEQREKAIARYREMKTNRKREGEGGDERDRDGTDGE